MSDKRLSEPVQKLLVSAQDEATRMGHEYVGSEHLLSSLSKNATGLTRQILDDSGVDFVEAVERSVPSNPHYGTTTRLPLTPRVRKILGFAEQYSVEFRDQNVDFEHILLGLLNKDSGVGHYLLTDAGIGLQKVKDFITDSKRIGEQQTPKKDAIGDLRSAYNEINASLEKYREMYRSFGVSEVRAGDVENSVRIVKAGLSNLRRAVDRGIDSVLD